MSLSSTIDRIAAKPAVKKFFEEKSLFGLLAAIVGGITALTGLIGKVLSVDKALAQWIADALVHDPVSQAYRFKAWFLPILIGDFLALAALILFILWAVLRRLSPTKAQKSLEEIMRSVRQIRDQGKRQSTGKAYDKVRLIYLINKDLSATVIRTVTVRAVAEPLHFLEFVAAVEESADSAESLSALNFRVRDLGSSPRNIVYLPSENSLRKKKACLFFLPPVTPNEPREFEITYQWPGAFRNLRKEPEDFGFEGKSIREMTMFAMEVYLEDGTGGVIDCAITGAQISGQSLTPAPYSSGAWHGRGYRYEVRDVPAADLHDDVALILKVELKS